MATRLEIAVCCSILSIWVEALGTRLTIHQAKALELDPKYVKALYRCVARFTLYSPIFLYFFSSFFCLESQVKEREFSLIVFLVRQSRIMPDPNSQTPAGRARLQEGACARPEK